MLDDAPVQSKRDVIDGTLMTCISEDGCQLPNFVNSHAECGTNCDPEYLGVSLIKSILILATCLSTMELATLSSAVP